MALKLETGFADATIRPLLWGLVEPLRTSLQAEGVDLVPAGNETQGLPVLRLTADFQRNREAASTALNVFGWLSPVSQGEAAPSTPARVVASQTIFRNGSGLGESLNGTALAVVRDLLNGSQASKIGTFEPRWVVPPSPSGITRVEGKAMKLDGAAPPLDYPWDARVMRIQGIVSFEVQVDQKGRVIQASVTEGALPLANAALAYASGLRFQVPPDLRARAPLTFGLSIRYSLPPICKVSKTLLEVVDGRSKESGLQPGTGAVDRVVREMLEKEGVQFVDAPSAEDPELRHLRIEIETLRSRGELCVYGVRARLSSHADRDLAVASPTTPLAIVWSGLVAGQRGETGFRDSLLKSVMDVVRATVDSPRPEKPSPREALPRPQDPSIVELEFRQIKIKRQPPAPHYPEAAKQQRIQGTVIVEIEVGEDGRPIRGITRKGPPELMLTALSYALDWDFEPALLNGKAVKARFKLTMPFRLR